MSEQAIIELANQLQKVLDANKEYKNELNRYTNLALKNGVSKECIKNIATELEQNI